MNVAAGLMNEAQWREHVFTGSWQPSRGGVRDVREPATGDVLTRVGLANAEDVATSATLASAAQPAWADDGAAGTRADFSRGREPGANAR